LLCARRGRKRGWVGGRWREAKRRESKAGTREARRRGFDEERSKERWESDPSQHDVHQVLAGMTGEERMRKKKCNHIEESKRRTKSQRETKTSASREYFSVQHSRRGEEIRD